MNRAWTYIISRELSAQELQQLLLAGKQFVMGWTAHENQLQGSFEIFENRIIVVQVNEDYNAASGCSIDKLTRFIKETEIAFNMQLMNRLLVAIKSDSGIEIVSSSQIKELLAQKKLNENTLVFNTSVANQQDLKTWEQPLKNTWLSKYLV